MNPLSIPRRPATRFLSARHVARIVRTQGVAASIAGIAANVTEDFRRWDTFDKSARLAAHSPRGVIELMPVSDARTYSFKYVNGHPGNPRCGLPTVMAFGVLADVATGMPVLVSELTLTTALRTAATSVVAARALARGDARRMAIIGNGAQSEFQAIAFHALLGVETFHLHDIDPQATARLLANLRRLGIAAQAFDTTAEAVRGCDIVTTVTADKTRATILTAETIEAGMHLNALGGDCPGKTELAPDVVAGASVFVEFEPQSRCEGDVQQMPADFPVVELWSVLRGDHPGRRSPEEVTLFDSVGFALEDYSALRYLRDAADALGLGETIELIPSLDDPRDLYGLVDRLGEDAPEAGRPLAAVR